MRCSEVRQKLDLFTTRELAPSVSERIDAHLESCADCRKVLGRLRRLEDLLATSSAPPVPEGFAARVLGRAEQRQAAAARRPRRPHLPSRLAWRRIRLSAATAASLAAGLVIGLLMGHQTWQSGHAAVPPAASQRADALAASGLDYLVEPGGDSLAQAYLGLTVAPDR